MKNAHKISRRGFMQMGASFGLLAALGRLQVAGAAPAQDYKALVCVFLFGGNDGHNTVVPLSNSQYSAYQVARGYLALPPSQLVSVWYTDRQGTGAPTSRHSWARVWSRVSRVSLPWCYR